MKRLILVLVMGVAGCERLGELPLPSRPTAEREPPQEIAAVVSAPPPRAGARTADDFDTTTDEQRAAATAVTPAAEERLGQVVVSLGNPADSGLWLETELVDAPRAGRIETTGGAAAIVELRPGSGGARISLAAMRLLGLPLTDLPTLTVYGR